MKEHICLELEKDKEDLELIIEKQIIFQDSLNKIIDVEKTNQKLNKGFIDILMNTKAEIQISSISMSSWDAAKNSGILELFDYNLLSEISELNEMIIMVNKTSEGLVDKIYNEDAFDKNDHFALELGRRAKEIIRQCSVNIDSA